MLVSIVIPTFNAAQFLAEAVGSALNQSYREFEIIIIDDGSTDNSRKIIESFGSKVRAEFGPNRGASAARNRGTQLAQGRFIQYLDADDLLTPNALEQRVQALERTGADVAYSDWQRLIEAKDGTFNLAKVVTRTIESINPDVEVAVFTDFWCPPAALLYRREIVEKIGRWNEALPVIQDARFLLDAALHGARFIQVPSVGAFYRVHKGQSLSRRNQKAFVRDCFENAVQIQQFWRERNKFTPGHREALLRVFSYVARASFENDRETFTKAREAIEKLEPGFSPKSPQLLALTSRLLGYERAESVALCYRRFKRLFKASG